MLLNLVAIVMAASIRRRARSVIAENRSKRWDQKTEANIRARAELFRADLADETPALCYSATNILSLMKRAVVVSLATAILEAVVLLRLGAPTERSFWFTMLGLFGGFVLINFCVLLLAVTTWAQPNRKVRWYGISLPGF